MTNEMIPLCSSHEPFTFGTETICRHCGSRLDNQGKSTEKLGPCTVAGHSRGYTEYRPGLRTWQCGCGRTWEEKL